MFVGRYYHTVEQKGRTAIPIVFRKGLGKDPVITRGLDGCLFLFKQEEWQHFTMSVNKTSFTKKAHRDFTRLMLNDASMLQFDAQGRGLIPEYLRATAQLKKNVVFAGSGNRVELWDRDTYHRYVEALEARAEDVSEAFEVNLPAIGNSAQDNEQDNALDNTKETA